MSSAKIRSATAFCFAFLACALCAAAVPVLTNQAAWLNLGDDHFSGWNHLERKDGYAIWNTSQDAVFQYPPGQRGWYHFGFRLENDASRDWREYYGLQLEMEVPKGHSLDLTATIATPPPLTPSHNDFLSGSKATTVIAGTNGWQRVVLPFHSFDFDPHQGAFLKYIQSLTLSARFADGRAGSVRVRNVRLLRARNLALVADVRGKSAPAGGSVRYDVTVMNCSGAPQNIALRFEKSDWQAMPATVEPAAVALAPGAATSCVVTVRVPENGIPPGGHESQFLRAIGDRGAAKIEFTTARELPHPNILHTVAGWDEVRANVKQYDWARKRQAEYVRAATDWKVPQAATPEQRAHGPEQHPYVFLNNDFEQLPKAAIAWQLTRDTNYAEKVALFLRRLADEKTGYPSVLAGTSMGEPQEGGDFQNVAIAYDAILDAQVLTAADRAAIDRTLRLYMQTVEMPLTVGNVGNWNVADDTAALFCALAMGDLAAADRYLYGPGGFTDFVTKGIMDDGWWWECSTSYNFWVASELTQCALACQPWGIDLLHRQFPANFSPNTIVTPWAVNPPYGMSFEKWGANHRNTRSIKQLWDAVPGVADYRGIAFGMNDGHEEPVGGSRLELGYYAFRDPAYVPLIKSSGQRDLIYGVPDLPETTNQPFLNSSCAENLGFALLRSQTANRTPRDQIQAVFKIGTQGGFHGHFDRVSLDSLTRYGRSFWNPESIWWGYGNFMYKFYVQNSVAHNLVVVDQKQQEAVPSAQLLFYSGKMIQVSAQETDAHWSDPPYGGMQYNASDSGGAVASLPALMKRLDQSFPLVTNRTWGQLGPFSDRVRQRRVGIVADDYVVIADALKSEQPHTFDDLYQMKGFQSLDAPGKEFLRHDAQFNSDPRSSAQFITDCDWYQADAPAVSRFLIQKDTGAENQHNEPGVLKLDVHSLWPPKQQVMLAQPAEDLHDHQWVRYDVSVDGKSVANGESGMWILGAVNLDVPVAGARELTIRITTSDAATKALFLAGAHFETDGGQGPALDVQPQTENVAAAKPGEDYYGGPIKIEGIAYPDAIPAEPLKSHQPAVIRIPIAGKGVSRFKAVLGADYPLGDETDRRKVFALRSTGTEAHFLTVLEPYEKTPMIKSATATGPDRLRVELADGRVQEITIQNLDGDGHDLGVRIVETRDGQVVREESTGKE